MSKKEILKYVWAFFLGVLVGALVGYEFGRNGIGAVYIIGGSIILAWALGLFGRRYEKTEEKIIQRINVQSTFVYCPACDYELISGGDFINHEGSFIVYRCPCCSLETSWDFSHRDPMLCRAWKNGRELNLKGD